MNKFNLELAESGADLILRNGSPAHGFQIIHDRNKLPFFIRVTDNRGLRKIYNKHGSWKVNSNSDYDLFMADSKPVYTQAMADNGELPCVGMECLIFNGELSNPTYEKAIILFVGHHKAMYSSDSCAERCGDLDLLKFKPLTPPIELIDNSIYQFELCLGDYRVGYYSSVRNSFMTCLLSGNKICGKAEASNIQLLEVK